MNMIFTCIRFMYFNILSLAKLSNYFSDTFLYFSYIICFLYFVANTRLYLHLHCVCAKLLLSFIGLASFYGKIWWSGNQPYLTMKRGFFYPTLEALWNPRQSQGFSKTIKKPKVM